MSTLAANVLILANEGFRSKAKASDKVPARLSTGMSARLRTIAPGRKNRRQAALFWSGDHLALGLILLAAISLVREMLPPFEHVSYLCFLYRCLDTQAS